MRFKIHMILGGLECAAAVTLVLIGWHLPNSRDVEQTFGNAREMAHAGGRQIDLIRRQMPVVRSGAGELHAWVIAIDRVPGITMQGLKHEAQAIVRQTDQFARDLSQVRNNLAEAEKAAVQYGRQTAHPLWFSRLLMWLVAGIVALHRGYLALAAIEAAIPAAGNEPRTELPGASTG